MIELSFFTIRILSIGAIISIYSSFEYNAQCPSNNFFDATLLECNNCPTNMVPTINGKLLLLNKNQVYLACALFLQ